MRQIFIIVVLMICLSTACVRLDGVGAGALRKSDVLLRFEGVAQKTVCVSGEFNGWAKGDHCMTRDKQGWLLRLRLPPGTYRYGFWVDGEQWVADPAALWWEIDGFGRRNGVMVVR